MNQPIPPNQKNIFPVRSWPPPESWKDINTIEKYPLLPVKLQLTAKLCPRLLAPKHPWGNCGALKKAFKVNAWHNCRSTFLKADSYARFPVANCARPPDSRPGNESHCRILPTRKDFPGKSAKRKINLPEYSASIGNHEVHRPCRRVRTMPPYGHRSRKRDVTMTYGFPSGWEE